MNLIPSQIELIDVLKSLLPSATDQVAIKYKTWYPAWREGIEITQEKIDKGENRYTDDNKLWKCIKPHTTQITYRPSIHTASIWVMIDEEHAGTKEDPIILPDELVSFEYEWGKYYKEGEDLYLCNRQGGKPGDKYTLAYKPSQLIGHYFTKVEE